MHKPLHWRELAQDAPDGSFKEELERTNKLMYGMVCRAYISGFASLAVPLLRRPFGFDMANQTRFRKDAYTMWVLRCLTMFSVCTMLLLVFQHPQPILSAQKSLLKVENLIERSKSSQLEF